MVDAEDRRHVVVEVGRWSCGSPWGSPSLREPSETEFWGRTVFSGLGKRALNCVPGGRRLRSWIGFLRNLVFPGEVLSRVRVRDDEFREYCEAKGALGSQDWLRRVPVVRLHFFPRKCFFAFTRSRDTAADPFSASGRAG